MKSLFTAYFTASQSLVARFSSH